jgi:hypothetical protein
LNFAIQLTSNNVSQQPIYHIVAHTCNTRNNIQPKTIPTSLPLPQPIFLGAPHFPLHIGKEYDLEEQLQNTLPKIFLWDLIQYSPNYHCILQSYLQQVMVPPST